MGGDHLRQGKQHRRRCRWDRAPEGPLGEGQWCNWLKPGGHSRAQDWDSGETSEALALGAKFKAKNSVIDIIF